MGVARRLATHMKLLEDSQLFLISTSSDRVSSLAINALYGSGIDNNNNKSKIKRYKGLTIGVATLVIAYSSPTASWLQRDKQSLYKKYG